MLDKQPEDEAKEEAAVAEGRCGRDGERQRVVVATVAKAAKAKVVVGWVTVGPAVSPAAAATAMGMAVARIHTRAVH